MVWLLVLMVQLYRHSWDTLDARAGLLFASLVFVVIPSVAIATSTDLNVSGYYVTNLPGVVVNQSNFNATQTIILAGLAALSIPLLLIQGSDTHRVRKSAIDPLLRRVPRNVWWVLGVLYVLTLAFVLYSYEGVAGAAAMAFDPVARDVSTLRVSSGVYGFLFTCCLVTAYYAAQRIQSQAVRLALFIPIVPLILPAANRGLLLISLMIGAASAFRMASRRAYAIVLAFLFALPLTSMALLEIRFSQSTFVGQSTADGPVDHYLTETSMVPTMSHVVGQLQSGRLDYVYGTDLALVFVWFVPRIIWPDKPLPLDYRLNEQLRMNSGRAFGTPISIFGGSYINFTSILYLVFLISLGYIVSLMYDRFRGDRLVSVFVLSFALDIVRVGDISREVWSFLISVAAVLVIRHLLVQLVRGYRAVPVGLALTRPASIAGSRA